LPVSVHGAEFSAPDHPCVQPPKCDLQYNQEFNGAALQSICNIQGNLLQA